MNKNLIISSLLSVIFLVGCHDKGGDFVGKWQGEGKVYLTEENGSNYFMNIEKNGDSYLIDIAFPESGAEKLGHIKYIAKLNGDRLVTGNGADQDTLTIDEKTGELVNTFKEHIKYKKISDGK